MKRLAVFFLLVISFCPAFADEGQHHEEMTAEQLGTVHFPVPCAAAVQQNFTSGVALLHSFWYEEAEKTFEHVAEDDPRCAMAHWGVAMSLWHELWNHPNNAVIARGMAEARKARSLHPKTNREKGYVLAIEAFYGGPASRDYQDRASAYSQAMGKIYHRHPEDHEGAAFYALSLLASEPENDGTSNRKQAAAILEKLFAEEPEHPGVAHYLIHTYDTPQMAALGLPAARRYAKIAPAAPHALHMPSHIFARLGLWQDDIDSNLASIAASRRSGAMHMGGESHEFHAMDYLVYAYLQSGREAEAERIIEEIKAMPPMQDMYGEGFDPRFRALTIFSARCALELHHWSEAAVLEPVPGASLGDSSTTYWARAIGFARSGRPAEARKELAEIEAIHKKLVEQHKTWQADAAEQDSQEAGAWIAHAESDNDAAIKALRSVAEKQESAGSEPDGAIPAREMLADLLLEMRRPEQALAEYEADLKFHPNRFNGLYGAATAAELAGKNQQATSYYAQLVKICAGSASDRPELSRAKALLAEK